MAVVGFDDIDEVGTVNWAMASYSQRIDRLVEEALNRLRGNLSATIKTSLNRVPTPATAIPQRPSPPAMAF
jgi:hypothetical protein